MRLDYPGTVSLEFIKDLLIATPIIYTRDQYTLAHVAISQAALEVLRQLQAAGFQAYLVGGSVRDLLLGREPKDFDVATDATPEQIKALFRRCRLIGRRFRLAHVFIGRELIEVATFRGEHNQPAQQTDRGMLLRDNVYGTLAEDALRRDFTLNALYYNRVDGSLIDYVNGMQDLQVGMIRLIGHPEQRYREDPVRMLRAVRFAAKLDGQIEVATEAGLGTLGHLLAEVPAARLTDEVLKLFMYGCAWNTFQRLCHYGLFARLFPLTDAALQTASTPSVAKLIQQGLHNTDRRVDQGLPVTPAFLFAILLWEPVRQHAQRRQATGIAPHPALSQAVTEVLQQQAAIVALPKRFSAMAREIWVLQPHFATIKGKRPARLVRHPRFRAAYDFMLLRVSVGEVESAIASWWTRYQAMHGPKPSQARRRYRNTLSKPCEG